MRAVIDTLILAAGVVGYLLAFGLTFRMQHWLRGRGAGFPRILIGALVRLLGLMAILFALSLAGRFTAVRHWPLWLRYLLSYGTVGALVLAPFDLAVALWRWWRQAQRGDWT